MAITFDYRYVVYESDQPCVLMDNRCWGASGGIPREHLSNKMQLEDLNTVIDWVKYHRDADKKRIVVWGYSYGGGHATYVAAQRPDLAGAICLCPDSECLALRKWIQRLSLPLRL